MSVNVIHWGNCQTIRVSLLFSSPSNEIRSIDEPKLQNFNEFWYWRVHTGGFILEGSYSMSKTQWMILEWLSIAFIRQHQSKMCEILRCGCASKINRIRKVFCYLTLRLQRLRWGGSRELAVECREHWLGNSKLAIRLSLDFSVLVLLCL